MNTKISALPAGAPAQGTDVLPVDRAGTNVSLQGSDIVTLAAATLVPQTTTVNGHALSSNVVVSASDITTGTLPHAQLPALVSGDIPNNAANTSGTAANLSGTPALPNGTTATTQAAFDNSGILSTDAYADNNFKGVSVTGFRDDFLTVVPATPATGNRILVGGDTPWVSAALVGTSNAFTAVATTFANPGIAELTTQAIVGDGLYIAKNNGATGGFGNLSANAGWEANFIFKLVQTTDVCIRMGFTNNPLSDTDTAFNSAMVEYDSANASSDTDFTWVTSVGGVATYATTNSKAVDTSFHHVRIRSTVIGTIGFTIDGGTEFTTTTTVPTSAAMGLYFQIINRTANTAVSLLIDFASYMAATGRT